MRAGAAALPHVVSAGAPALSPDGRVAVIEVQYPVVERLDPSDLQRMEAYGATAAADSPLQVEMRGDLFFAFAEAETGIGEVLGLVAAIVILLVAFGSVVAMGLPIGMAVLGLALGIGSLSLIAYLVEIPSWAPVLGSMVGLGVGIDYALFVVTRHREYLARGLTVEESVGRALATAGKAVVFAGGTVVIAILGLGVAGIPFMTAGGIAIAVIVLVMVTASITVLPAFLGVAGPWVNRLGLHRPSPTPGVPEPTLGAVGRPRRPARQGLRDRGPAAAARRGRTRSGDARRAARTTARSPSRAPSAAPTTWWPTGSALAPTGRS